MAYVDCKSFAGERFGFAELDSAQVERAVRYNNWGLEAGFVVFFRKASRVAYFSGHQIAAKGAGNGFGVLDGLSLGPWHDFDLRLVLRENKP